jgi:hypothetical protein
MSMIGRFMPIRKTYWYATADSSDIRYELVGTMRPLRDVAMDAAEDYHGNHDGWESRWPLDFIIYESEDGPPAARFEIERETVPQFYAWERELPPAADVVDPSAADTGTPTTRDESSS